MCRITCLPVHYIPACSTCLPVLVVLLPPCSQCSYHPAAPALRYSYHPAAPALRYSYHPAAPALRCSYHPAAPALRYSYHPAAPALQCSYHSAPSAPTTTTLCNVQLADKIMLISIISLIFAHAPVLSNLIYTKHAQ